MLLSFYFIIDRFKTSTPMCCLMIRWHSIEFGILCPWFWSCEWTISLSPALHGWGKATQQPGKQMDGNLIIELWLEKWHLVELRGKKKKQQKATTKMTAATTKMTATTTKTPQHPRMVEGSQGTLKPEKPSTGGCWHTEVWGRDEKIHTECSGRGNCSCIRPWSLFLCKPCRPSPLCGKCLIPGVFFPRRERKC